MTVQTAVTCGCSKRPATMILVSECGIPLGVVCGKCFINRFLRLRADMRRGIPKFCTWCCETSTDIHEHAEIL